MLSLYQKHFSFKAVMFSTSQDIQLYCEKYDIRVLSSFPVNRYGLPVLKNMLLLARSLYATHYVGYMNSDILFSTALFQSVSLLRQQEERHTLSSSVSMLCELSCVVLHLQPSVRCEGIRPPPLL